MKRAAGLHHRGNIGIANLINVPCSYLRDKVYAFLASI